MTFEVSSGAAARKANDKFGTVVRRIYFPSH
ncbi:hypothetical protein ES703_73136 [subsurface metagenome]